MIRRVLYRAVCAAGAFGAGLVPPVGGQTTFHACYVPSVGAVYMIKLTGLPASCLAAAHVEISWTEGGAPADGSITTAKLADNSVTSPKIVDGAVTSADIANGTIAAVDLAPNAVATSNIQDLSVTTAKLPDNAVTSAKIQDGQVTGADIANSTIADVQLAAGAVTNAKIAGGAVTRDKIAPDSRVARGLAFVSFNGTVIRQVGLVSASRALAGLYFLTFLTAAIEDGYYLVTTGTGTTGTGCVAEQSVIATGNSMYVYLSHAGVGVDCSFTVVIF